jgi:hypothetical protein
VNGIAEVFLRDGNDRSGRGAGGEKESNEIKY